MGKNRIVWMWSQSHDHDVKAVSIGLCGYQGKNIYAFTAAAFDFTKPAERKTYWRLYLYHKVNSIR